MTLCVRCTNNLNVYERFLGFIGCSIKQDAQGLG